MKKGELLDDLVARYHRCERCPDMAQHRKTRRSMGQGGNVVPGYGNPDSSVLIIGEAPGNEEDIHGFPFIGKSGMLLNQFLIAVCAIDGTITKVDKLTEHRGLDIYITNSVQCLPPLDKRKAPNAQEMKYCQARLLEEIQIVDPVGIILLGGKALSVFFGNKRKIMESRGRFYTAEVPGIFGPVNYPVFPLLHPSFLLRNEDWTEGGYIWQTLKQLRAFYSILDRFNYIVEGTEPPFRDLDEKEKANEL